VKAARRARIDQLGMIGEVALPDVFLFFALIAAQPRGQVAF
jgi:hypothetical protein